MWIGLCTYCAAALMLSFSTSTASKLDLVAPGPDLLETKASIMQSVVHQTDVFKHAIRIVSSLESAPSCHRLAARTLLDSCQSLETSKDGSFNVALDQVKSLFAARLAVCELTGAHASVPTQCLAMIPKPLTASDHGIRCLLPGSSCERPKSDSSTPRYNFEDLNEHQINQCLNTLESRPQWWTSYSNARQNAVVMCDAARSEIDKEELLNNYKQMAKVSSDISHALSQATDRSDDNLKLQEEFALRLQRLQSSVTKEMKNTETQARGFLSGIINQVEKLSETVFESFSQKAATATETVEDLNTRLKQSTAEAHDMQDSITKSMQTFSSQQLALAEAQQQNSQLSQESALALHSSLDAVQRQQIEPLALALRDLRTMIDTQTQLMQLMFAKQGTVDSRLDALNKTIYDLQGRASSAEESLKYHIEAQNLLFENLTVNMAASNELASSIKTTLDDVGRNLATSIFGLFSPLRNILASWPVFAIVLGLLSYLVLGIRAARRVAVVGLILFASSLLYDQVSHVVQHAADFRNTYMVFLSASTPKVSILLIFGAVTLTVAITPYIVNYRKRRAETVREQDDFFADTVPMRKRTASILPEYKI